MNNTKNVPEIRFKGCYDEDGNWVAFTHPWEQRKFGDYNDLMTGYPFESDKFSEDGIKLVRGMNVKRGYLDFSEDICVKWNSCVGLESFLLKDGDILIQMDGALIGKSYAKIKENQLPALLVQRVTRARTNNKFASQDFMYQTIQRDFLRYIEMNKTETAVPHLSLNDIRNFEIMVPCLAEQKKIGDYFESLDHLITLHQRKCDTYEKLKICMMQKLFNQVLRFKADDGSDFPDWKEKKLDEVFKERVERSKGGESLLSVTIAQGVVMQSETDKRNIASENKSNYKIVKKNDLAYNTMRMWQGAEGVSIYDGIVSPAYTIITALDGNNSYFF